MSLNGLPRVIPDLFLVVAIQSRPEYQRNLALTNLIERTIIEQYGSMCESQGSWAIVDTLVLQLHVLKAT